MPITVEYKETGDFKLTPAGQYQAVCCELIDMGFSTKNYKNQDTGVDEQKNVHEVCYVFQVNKVDDESGKRFEVRTKPFNLVLSEKSNLKAFLLQWRGHDLLPEELKPPGVLLDALVGKNALLQVVHNQSKGKTYANIGSIMPLMEGIPEIQPLNYESKQEGFNKWKAKSQAQAGQAAANGAAAPPRVDGVNAEQIPW
jgi:hypothetical protein